MACGHCLEVCWGGGKGSYSKMGVVIMAAQFACARQTALAFGLEAVVTFAAIATPTESFANPAWAFATAGHASPALFTAIAPATPR